MEFEVPRLLFLCPFPQHVHGVTRGKGGGELSRFIVPSLYSQNLMLYIWASALGCCCPVGTGLQDLFLKWLLDSTACHCSHHGHALFHVTDSCYLWLEGLIQEPVTAGFTYWVVLGKTTFLSTSSILDSVEANPKSCKPQGPQRPLDPACHHPCAANCVIHQPASLRHTKLASQSNSGLAYPFHLEDFVSYSSSAAQRSHICKE